MRFRLPTWFLLSGGTSKGAGDLSYRVVAELTDPGVVAHGVALKPGKPICLAGTGGRAVVVLPGFPTSAIFTFHEFVAPVIRMLAGRGSEARTAVSARLAVRVNSEIGRTEYLLVGLVEREDESAGTSLAAYPMGQGSGSVTTFSRADGFATIGRHEEIVQAGTLINVQLLGRELQLADLVVIGSHCIGLDYLLGELQSEAIRSKFIAVGSTGGLDAAKRGECDISGIHLLDPQTNEYNQPFLTRDLELIPGYGRLQGIVFRSGDSRFEGRSLEEAVAGALSDPGCLMVNRNQGSGTRVLIDRMLGGKRPPGYAVQPRNHNAVAAAVLQGRADWGMTLDTIARNAGLGFLPVQAEQFDFIVPRSRAKRPGVACVQDAPRARVDARGVSTTRDETMTAGGIVLCGGRSTRMGTSKADLPFGTETMLQRVVRLLAEIVDPIVAVAAGDQQLPKLPENVIVTRDEREQRGPLEGLRAGLKALPESVEMAYVTSCDVPLLVPGFVTQMIELIGEHDISVMEIDGFPHPLSAVYRRNTLPTYRSAAGRR